MTETSCRSWSNGKALAEQQTNPKQFAIDNGIALTLFRGETLQSLLLQAYAVWFVGDLALYAAIGLPLGAVVVFLTFLYELLMEPKREGIVELQERPLRKKVAAS